MRLLPLTATVLILLQTQAFALPSVDVPLLTFPSDTRTQSETATTCHPTPQRPCQ